MKKLFLLISISLLLILTGCETTKPKPNPNDPGILILKNNSEGFLPGPESVDLAEPNPMDIIQFDISTKEGQLELREKLNLSEVKDFDNEIDRQSALHMCKMQGKYMREKLEGIYSNVEMIMLGRHHTDPKGVICNPNVMEKKQATELCHALKGKWDFFGITKNNQKFYCINKKETQSNEI